MSLSKVICFLLIPAFFTGCSMIAGPDANSMPDFDLQLPDSTTILNSRNIPEGKPILLIFYSIDCEHCRAETEDLLKNIDSLKNIRIYFATCDRFERMKLFNKHFKIYQYPNITVGKDINFKLVPYYGIKNTPAIILYSSNKQLKVAYGSEVRFSRLIKEIKKL
jgi:thiol-disulfide isomerase/thioredoxin